MSLSANFSSGEQRRREKALFSTAAANSKHKIANRPRDNDGRQMSLFVDTGNRVRANLRKPCRRGLPDIDDRGTLLHGEG